MIALVNRLAYLMGRQLEILAAVFVLAVIFMMVLPLPTGLVDTLIALNISVSVLLVMLALYMPGPLAFSTFPSLLLLSTLFRLALTITTTRLILLQHDAGEIVDTFGSLVIGGELLVGMVVFLILTLVNYLVITKGSERVAEVAARFTLDGMPGKQMSIDSDLRAGLISPEKARERRQQLNQESQLFGAMDGAMKFVKGDAIAILLVVFVNLVGGFAMGVINHGMSPAEAIAVYSTLTVGDGLVAQIPALLVSMTAGIIITRVTQNDEESPDSGNLGRELGRQLMQQPRAWLTAAAALAGFGLIPGMPTLVFWSLSGFIGALGWLKLREQKQAQQEKATAEDPGRLLAEANEGYKDVRQFDPVQPYLLVFSDEAQNSEHAAELVRRTRQARNTLVTRMGFTLPNLSLKFEPGMEADQFRFEVNEIPQLQGSLHPDEIAVSAQQRERLQDLELDFREGEQTWFQERGLLWLDANARETLSHEGINFQDAVTIGSRTIETTLLKTASRFIGIQEAHALSSWLESEKPELAKEMQRALPTAKFAEVLRRLAAECVSLRNLRAIAETLVEWGQKERDTALLTEHVRKTLRSQICHACAENGTLRAVLLAPDAEEKLRQATQNMGSDGVFSIPPDLNRRLLQQFAAFWQRGRSEGTRPVLIVPQDLRRFIRRMVEHDLFSLNVLGYTEIVPEVRIESMGRISAALPENENGQAQASTQQAASLPAGG